MYFKFLLGLLLRTVVSDVACMLSVLSAARESRFVSFPCSSLRWPLCSAHCWCHTCLLLTWYCSQFESRWTDTSNDYILWKKNVIAVSHSMHCRSIRCNEYNGRVLHILFAQTRKNILAHQSFVFFLLIHSPVDLFGGKTMYCNDGLSNYLQPMLLSNVHMQANIVKEAVSHAMHCRSVRHFW